MQKIRQRIFLILFLLNTINLLVAYFLPSLRFTIPLFDLKQPAKLCILAAHQDDAVIMSAGLAMRNIELGGSVHIVYLTRAAEEGYAETRKSEAVRAWHLISKDNIQFSFLDFQNEWPWPQSKIDSAEYMLKYEIEEINPDIVVIPLKEGGSAEHDLLNDMFYKVRQNNSKYDILQAAEYNPFYIMQKTPRKMLWFLARLLPLIPYRDPNYGLNPENQKLMAMSKRELNVKIEMLNQFNSQADIIPISQFGYPDLFDATRDYPDYFIKVSGKYMSVWAVITIALFLMLFLSLGVFLYSLSGHSGIIIIVWSIFSIIMVIYSIKEPRQVLENLLPVYFMSFGFYLAFAVFMCGKIRKKLSLS